MVVGASERTKYCGNFSGTTMGYVRRSEGYIGKIWKHDPRFVSRGGI